MIKRNTRWTKVEIQVAVATYFKLLDTQKKLDPINKSEIYRKLLSTHPTRSVKAFELKFQTTTCGARTDFVEINDDIHVH